MLRSGSPDWRGGLLKMRGIEICLHPIASNDLAAGWAQDEAGRPLYPLIPGGARQRELALRGGVNLVMYALTGNYKADQVHARDLLERLSR